jgi:hypothetical protein
MVLAACSSDPDVATDTTAVIPTVTAGDPPPTTPAPATTDSTPSPPTTLDPASTLAADVEADLLEAFRLGREAEQDPFNAEKEAAALERRIGFSRERLAEVLAEYRQRNYAIRANEGSPASVMIEAPPSIVADAAFAEVLVCEVNSWVLVEVGAGPDGSDSVVDPTVVATRSTIFLREVEGTWKVEGGEQLAQWENQRECPGT